MKIQRQTWRVFLVCILLFSSAVSIAYATPGVDTTNDQIYKEAYVPCGHTEIVNGVRSIPNPCGFDDVLELGRRLITGWILAGVIIATMGFAYAGYLYITAMGSEEKIKHAHSIFYKILLGFIFMLSAWLIAKVFEGTFLTPEQQERSFLDDGS